MAAILLHLFAARPRFFSIRPEIISLSRPDILCFQLYGKSKQLQDADPPTRLPGRSAESVNPTLLESRSSVAGRTASSRRRSQAIGLRPVSYQAAGRCRTIIEQYIREGGALIMIGGFMSFQGVEAKARYAGTPVEQALPVSMMMTDDCVEVPQGFSPSVVQSDHPIMVGLQDHRLF
jgi:hypothetical protein